MNGYSEALDYLYGLEQFGIVFGLDHITRILSLIGDPQTSLRAVHIAGTNGKGSVASVVAAIAQQAGYRVGLYTSPHLISFTERITVDGTPITEGEVVELTQFIRGRIEASGASIEGNDPQTGAPAGLPVEGATRASDRQFIEGEALPALPVEGATRAPLIAASGAEMRFTFFDFTTALAFEYFKRKGIDLAVIEVGLGGRLDSTNVLLPLVSVITNVALDHQDYLGSEVEDIAREKAGIIRKDVPVVTGAQDKALEVIKGASTGTNLYVLGDAFTYSKKTDQHMSYKGMETAFDDLVIGLKGDHQLFNAALAVCVIELLGRRGFVIGEEAIRAGLVSVDWPGRLELIPGVHGKPSVLLDGAHNPDGARTLAMFLEAHFPGAKKILVFGVMKDKDFGHMLSALLPVVDQVVLTRPDISRAASPSDLASHAAGAVLTDSVVEAIGVAGRMTGPGDVIVIAGSFYTIGEAKKVLNEEM